MSLTRRPLRAARPLGPTGRTALLGALAGVAGSLLYAPFTGQVGPMPLWLFAGLAYAVLIAVAAAVIYRFAPRLAPFLEWTSASRLGIAFAAPAFPDLGRAVVTSPLLMATLVVGGAIALRFALRRLALAWAAEPPRPQRPAPLFT